MTEKEHIKGEGGMPPLVNPNPAADVASVVERYGIPGFTYHTWSPGRRRTRRSSAGSGSAGGRRERSVASSTPSSGEVEKMHGSSHHREQGGKGAAAAPSTGASGTGVDVVPWSEPDDLVGATLPILEDLPDIRSQIDVLRRDSGSPPSRVVATAAKEEEGIELPALSALKRVEEHGGTSDSVSGSFPEDRGARADRGGAVQTVTPSSELDEDDEDLDESVVEQEAAASFELKASRALATLSGELVYPPLPGRKGRRQPPARKREDPVQRVFTSPEEQREEWRSAGDIVSREEGRRGPGVAPAQRSGFEWTFSESAEERRRADATPRRSSRARPPQEGTSGAAASEGGAEASDNVADRLRHLLLKGIEDE